MWVWCVLIHVTSENDLQVKERSFDSVSDWLLFFIKNGDCFVNVSST